MFGSNTGHLFFLRTAMERCGEKDEASRLPSHLSVQQRNPHQDMSDCYPRESTVFPNASTAISFVVLSLLPPSCLFSLHSSGIGAMAVVFLSDVLRC